MSRTFRLPQVRGMYAGDRARKEVLVELRFPAAQSAATTVH